MGTFISTCLFLLSVSGVSPPASVIIHSNWTQIFTDESLSLSCGVQGNSTGWRLRWFTGRGGESKCPTDWRSETGSTCSISSASSSDSGVYWCQSESGEQSNLVNITVHGNRPSDTCLKKNKLLRDSTIVSSVPQLMMSLMCKCSC